MSRKCDRCGKFCKHLHDVWADTWGEAHISHEICDNCAALSGDNERTKE